MGHEDVGHFADKHPEGSKVDPELEKKIKQHVVGDQLTCIVAHNIAKAFSISPSQVGIAMDLMEIRIGKCQMGLFGYQPKKRIVKPAKHVSPQLQKTIQDAVVDQRISCVRCWRLADANSLRKIDISSACEALKIKINQCQLGAF
jgi:hypothetical protein